MGQAGSPSSALPSDQKPDVMYADIGGMDIQKQEVREAVELPLTHFELYKQVRSRDRKGPTEFQVGDRTPWLILSLHLCFSDWHRSSPRRPHVRPAWLWEDDAGKGCGSSHHR